MGQQNPVVQTAMCKCVFGAAPATISVTSQQTVQTGNMPQATIMDTTFVPPVATFGTCFSFANPAVVAGPVPKPVPCTPAPAGTWIPTSPMVLVGGKPILTKNSLLMCACGAGLIQVSFTPAVTVKS